METMVPHPSHRLLYIKVREQTIVDREGSLYEAVRWAWRIDPERAEEADYVIAVVKRICKGVFAVQRWKPSGRERGRFELTAGSWLTTSPAATLESSFQRSTGNAGWRTRFAMGGTGRDGSALRDWRHRGLD